MTSTARIAVSTLPKGHEFTPASFVVDAERAAAYLRAVGDAGSYDRAVPPLAAVALGLSALQEQISLPEGSLHTSQEVEQSAAIRVDEPLTLSGRIAQRSERQGFVISVLEFEIATPAGVTLRARTTVMAPGAAS